MDTVRDRAQFFVIARVAAQVPQGCYVLFLWLFLLSAFSLAELRLS